jgi:hypothetical protein
MLRNEKETWRSLVASLALVSFACQAASAQSAHAGPVTGVIDGVALEGDAYYVHGWACQEGNPGSISINVYANHAAGAKPMPQDYDWGEWSGRLLAGGSASTTWSMGPLVCG